VKNTPWKILRRKSREFKRQVKSDMDQKSKNGVVEKNC
jgi:hypothetical protein